jgi:hypothetical protein
MSYIGPDISLTTYCYINLANYKNKALMEDSSYKETILVGVALPFVALLGVIETIARGIFFPLGYALSFCGTDDILSDDKIDQENLTFTDKIVILSFGGTLVTIVATWTAIMGSCANCSGERLEVPPKKCNLTIWC